MTPATSSIRPNQSPASALSGHEAAMEAARLFRLLPPPRAGRLRVFHGADVTLALAVSDGLCRLTPSCTHRMRALLCVLRAESEG